MVRVRKLVLAIAAASALSSGVAHALGLGEVTLRSTLNQPLDAEIELLEVRDLSSDEVLPKLGSAEDFIKAGVDRQYFLTDLKFTPIVKPNGRSAIRVTSSKAVREPYLNFLVEVLWPNGRLLREYTLLLDPPLYSPQTTAAVAPQIPQVAPVAAAASRPVAPQSVQRSQAPRISGNEYRVTNNDTLWEIAQRVGGGSVHQTMLAIADLNPDAFIGGNINRMKSGQVLRLPDEQQVRRRSSSEAVAEVAEHNTAWRQGRAIAARQLDATHKAVASEAPAAVEARDSLKLVAADAGQSAVGSDAGSAERKALADSLAVTQESLDSSRSENTELKGRLEDLQSQLDKLQKLVELKDNQLAQLQANLAAVPEVVAPAVEPVVEAVVERAVVEPEITAEPVVEVAPEAPQVPEAQSVGVEVAEVDYNYSEEPVVDAPAEIAVSAPALAPAEPEQSAPAPVIASEPAPASFVDDLLANPTKLGLAGGGILALLLGLMVLSRRNASKEAELQAKLSEQEDGFDDLDANQTRDVGGFVDLAEEAVDAQVQPSEERVSAQTADVLGEADIYIAYGRFNQAAELLQGAIDDEPQRTDLRLKLMEVQAELADRDAFTRQERDLREMGGVSEEIEQLRAKYPAMAVAAVVAAGTAAVVAAQVNNEAETFDLDSFELDEPAASQSVAPEQVLDEALDLSFGSFGSGLADSSEPAAATEAEAFSFALPETELPKSDQAVTGEVDFDLSLDELSFDGDVDVATAAPSTESSGEFLLDLEAAPAVAELDELDAFSLALNDSQPAEADAELSADFDLSLEDEALETLDLADNAFSSTLDAASAELEEFAASLGTSTESGFNAPTDSALGGELDADDDFDFLSGTDETATKLDLARAYIDMGDSEGARDILDEVVAEGNEAQQNEAREMIAKLV